MEPDGSSGSSGPSSHKHSEESNSVQDLDMRPPQSGHLPLPRTSLSPAAAEVNSPNKRPALVCDFYARGWCIKGTSCRFLHVKDNPNKAASDGLGESNRHSGSPSVPDPSPGSVGTKSAVSYNRFPEAPKFLQKEYTGVGSDVKRQSGFVIDYGDRGAAFGDGFRPESAVSSTHQLSNPYSHSRSAEELHGFQHQYPHSYSMPSLASDLPGSSSNVMSAWTGSSLPFSYSSLSATQISSSLLHRSPQISTSKSDSLPLTKRKVSVDDWEPSVPFEPSIEIRSMISLPERLYDPLLDSVDLPKVGDALLKASFFSQGSSVVNNGEAVSENRHVACNEDTMSVSSHNAHHEKDAQITEAETVGTSTCQRNSDRPGDSRRHHHGTRDESGVKVNNIRQNSQMGARHFVEQTVNKESKALKQFRSALIEFVKESLKPKWRQGNLSKEAHKKIVKKAVEKVISTLPAEQVPTSMELITQYLTSSRIKIDKLVEGYAEIYSKVMHNKPTVDPL